VIKEAYKINRTKFKQPLSLIIKNRNQLRFKVIKEACLEKNLPAKKAIRLGTLNDGF